MQFVGAVIWESVFTVSGNLDFPIELLSFKREWHLRDLSPEAQQLLGDGKTQDVISKVLIPGSLKREALVHLHYAGVTPASLFPGLDGLGEAIAQQHLKVVPLADRLSGPSYGIESLPLIPQPVPHPPSNSPV